LMLAIKVDRVRRLQLMHPLLKGFPRASSRRDGNDSPSGPSISFILENLFPSISARHDVVDDSGKLNPRRSQSYVNGSASVSRGPVDL
jgi:hypothetical protein